MGSSFDTGATAWVLASTALVYLMTPGLALFYGGMVRAKNVLGMLPGVGKLKSQLEGQDIDKKVLGRQAAIISSMTMKERRNPDIIKASRKKRIAAGSGVTVQDVNRLLKQYDDMTTMMKKMNKLGQKGLMRHGLGALMPKGMSTQRRPY